MKEKIEKIKQLERDLAELKIELAEFEKNQQPKKWQDKLLQPKDKGSHYYFMASNLEEGLMVSDGYGYGSSDRKPEHAFRTREQAALVKEKMLLMQEMLAFAHVKNEWWKPNWNTIEQIKWGLTIDMNVTFFESYSYNNLSVFGIAVKSKEIAKEMLDIFGERIKKYYNEQY